MVLALPADEQVRANGAGCVACDLDSDFDHARSVTIGNATDLTDEQHELLNQIESVLRSKQPPDYECFNPAVLHRPVWQELRVLAAEALRAFGWEHAVVQPFTEVQPGVWHRPPAEAEPCAAPDPARR